MALPRDPFLEWDDASEITAVHDRNNQCQNDGLDISSEDPCPEYEGDEAIHDAAGTDMI